MADDIKKTHIPGLGEVSAVLLTVKELKEGETTATLSDGTIVRFKAILLESYRAEKYNEVGEPVYSFKIAPIVLSVDPPESLKKQSEGNN